jgi:hypothetical protein
MKIALWISIVLNLIVAVVAVSPDNIAFPIFNVFAAALCGFALWHRKRQGL